MSLALEIVFACVKQYCISECFIAVLGMSAADERVDVNDMVA